MKIRNLSPDDRKALRKALAFKKQRSAVAKVIAGDEAEVLGHIHNKVFRVRAIVMERSRVVATFAVPKPARS